MFTVCVNLVLESEHLFQIIFSLLYSIIVDTFDVNPHCIYYGKRFAKPSNTYALLAVVIILTAFFFFLSFCGSSCNDLILDIFFSLSTLEHNQNICTV